MKHEHDVKVNVAQNDLQCLSELYKLSTGPEQARTLSSPMYICNSTFILYPLNLLIFPP